MSILSKVTFAGWNVYSPEDALSLLATRGEWSELARLVAQRLDGTTPGSLVRFDAIGLHPDDFKRTTASKSRKVGEIDYSGITAAARSKGILVKRLVDESRGFYMPHNSAELIEKAKVQRQKAAAKSKSKSKAGK